MALSKAAQALSAADVLEMLHDDLQKVEEEIRSQSIAPLEASTSINKYLLGNGGKRLRPTLLLLVSRLMGDITDSAIKMAAVVEMVHTATLIHDDVIDLAETRRGKPSVNVIWGNHTSVLAGDWLYMQAFQLALRERNFQVLDVLISLTQMMVEGELLQLERLGRPDITEEEYLELVDRKTAGLFLTCAKLGALVSGGSDGAAQRLGECGWNLGMAFQFIDDILDFTAKEKTLGKPVGNDLREGKMTLPVIYALETAADDERAQLLRALEQRSYQEVPFARVREIIETNGGFARVRTRAQAFTQRACAIIAEFPDSPYQRALLAVTEMVTDRDK